MLCLGSSCLDRGFCCRHKVYLQIKSPNHHRVSSFVSFLSAVRGPVLPVVQCLKRIVPHILSSFLVVCCRSESVPVTSWSEMENPQPQANTYQYLQATTRAGTLCYFYVLQWFCPGSLFCLYSSCLSLSHVSPFCMVKMWFFHIWYIIIGLVGFRK